MEQPLKHLPEVVTYVRKLEARIEELTGDFAKLVAKLSGHVEAPSVTLDVYECNGNLWLVAIDAKDNVRYLAQFSDPNDAVIFLRAFGLAKRSAHAAGASGI